MAASSPASCYSSRSASPRSTTICAIISWSGLSATLGAKVRKRQRTPRREGRMTRSWKTAWLAASVLGLAAGPAFADDPPIKIGTALDFTAVYTFVTAEYSQGQRDYISLLNAKGGIKGHPVEIMVVDTGNQPQRGIE